MWAGNPAGSAYREVGGLWSCLRLLLTGLESVTALVSGL